MGAMCVFGILGSYRMIGKCRLLFIRARSLLFLWGGSDVIVMSCDVVEETGINLIKLVGGLCF